MASNNVLSPNQVAKHARALKAGTAKEVPASASMMVNGTRMTGQELRSKLEGIERLSVAVKEARAAEKRALTAFRKELTGVRFFLADYQAALRVHLGPLSPRLASFGISPPKKRRKATTAEKLLAVARRRATRAVNLSRDSSQAVTTSPSPSSPAGSAPQK